MFAVGWRSGYLLTRIVGISFNNFGYMGNCADKSVGPKPKSNPPKDQFSIVCKEDELREGELKEFPLADKLSCLVAKQNGKIFALGNKCSHYGAPLVNGALGDGIVTCPWHGACFSLETGDIEDFPGLDSLPKYDVSVANGEVKVHFTSNAAKRVKSMCKHDPDKSNECVVVIGGGAAGQECVETLRNRKNPFVGRIIMITLEGSRPYDRIKLSKALTSTAEDLALRPVEFYKDADIEVLTSTEAVGVDTENKEIKLRSGDLMSYDYLVIATGGRPRTLSIPGSYADGIFVLRSPWDANQIAGQSEGRNLVIIGSSFIGMEVAAALVGKAASVTIVGNGPVPFAAMGDEIGKYVQGLHEEKGVKFILNASPDEFVSNDDGQLTHVVINGEQIVADVCVLGVGVVPSTTFLVDSNIDMDSRGNIIVNEFMETSVKGIFAAGDIASFPLSLPTTTPNTLANVGHWQLALAHGKCVGQNVASDEMSQIKTVPFFWTVQFGKSIRYAGYGHGHDDIVYDGEVSAGKFVAYYCKEDNVAAVATLMRDPIASHFANLLREGRLLAKGDALTEWYKKV